MSMGRFAPARFVRPLLRQGARSAHSPHSQARLVALATALAFLFAFTASHSSEAAKKKKKKKPAPPTATVEIDTPAPAPAAPAPAPAPQTEAPAEPAEPAEAHAEPTPPPHHGEDRTATYTPLGEKHTLVLDDLSGFRASTAGGVAYAGPLGFSTQSFSENIPAANGTNAGTDTIHETTFWFAPSLDYFLFEHISIGVLLELAFTAANYNQSVFGTATKNQSLPSTVNVTVLPRAGWMLALSDHWALWPRLGLGWGLLEVNALTNAGTGTTRSASSSSTFLVDVDVGVLYRIDPRWFLRAAPELSLGPGAGLVSFSVGAGFGYMWSL